MVKTARVFSAVVVVVALALAGCAGCRRRAEPAAMPPAPVSLPAITLSQSADRVACYDFVEVVLTIATPNIANPFTEVFVSGEFGLANALTTRTVEGFADSSEGNVFRVRFMPAVPGDYSYRVKYWQGNLERVFTGSFHAADAARRGLVIRDPEYPWHFLWAGTSEHYFLNGTTAFLLMGWDDDRVIETAIDRLHRLSVNRIRVLLDGRTNHFWGEPIQPGNGFRATLNPWEAARPDDAEEPHVDYTRFTTRYWQKFERMVRYARERDVVVSVIFGWNDTPVHPAAGSDDERRYIRYAVARLAAYSNVTWDLGDDLDGFRSDAWTHEAGLYLYALDPYHHLATSHPADEHNEHQDRGSEWFGMTSVQKWRRPLHGWMLEQRQVQAKTGRIVPQVNEEYGYEDHYPQWAPYQPPSASSDANRRTAWEIAMAGAYQTTGETAKRGTGVAPDTGGGWVNGRGDDTMTMLDGYAHMVEFFTGFEWWKTEPHDELIEEGGFCLAEPGTTYVAYLPQGGRARLKLQPGRYAVRWFDPRTGEYGSVADAEGSEWTSPESRDHQDWVLLLTVIAPAAPEGRGARDHSSSRRSGEQRPRPGR